MGGEEGREFGREVGKGWKEVGRLEGSREVWRREGGWEGGREGGREGGTDGRTDGGRTGGRTDGLHESIHGAIQRSAYAAIRSRCRAKNMANQSKTQISLLVIKQHELLLIAVAHKCMQLKTHNKRINHRRRSFVGHTLMDLVQIVAHYSLCLKYIYISDISVLHRLDV